MEIQTNFTMPFMGTKNNIANGMQTNGSKIKPKMVRI